MVGKLRFQESKRRAHTEDRAKLVDVGMPNIDGLTLISMIREKHATLPIVMFTGLGYDEESMQAAQKAGANGYVSKGLGPAELYSVFMRVPAQSSAPPVLAQAS